MTSGRTERRSKLISIGKNPPAVLAKLKAGDESWEKMVPPEVVQIIKEREFFGYRAAVAA